MKVLITGGRNWNNSQVIREALERIPQDATIIHGGQKTQMCRPVQRGRKWANEVYYIGADYQADTEARALGFTPQVYKADWDAMEALGLPRGAAGPLRNSQMVNILIEAKARGEAVQVLAFHENWQASKGTKDTITKSVKAKLPVTVFDGKTDRAVIVL